MQVALRGLEYLKESSSIHGPGDGAGEGTSSEGPKLWDSKYWKRSLSVNIGLACDGSAKKSNSSGSREKIDDIFE